MNMIPDTAFIGDNCKIGFNSIIKDYTVIGENCIIGSNVIIYEGSKIGNNVRIDDNTVIGKQPMKAVTSKVTDDEIQPPCTIQDGCIIGTSVVIYAGSFIGKDCLVADLSTIRENVIIGEKTIIGRGVAVENYCKIGSFCKLETNVYITAYSLVEDYAFIAPCVVTSNDNYAGRTEKRFESFKGVTVKKGGRIGANATILPGKTINEDGFVGAGSVVTKDVSEGKIVTGNPAKVLKNVPLEQLLKNK